MRRASTNVRLAGPGDLDVVVALASALWPDQPKRALRAHMRATLEARPRSTLPLVVFLAERSGRAVGFVEVGLRSHAEECDARRSVGFIEGWFVTAPHRRHGVGRALVEAAERWSRTHGCIEVASNTEVHNTSSRRAHAALGFTELARLVNFAKRLA